MTTRAIPTSRISGVRILKTGTSLACGLTILVLVGSSRASCASDTIRTTITTITHCALAVLEVVTRVARCRRSGSRSWGWWRRGGWDRSRRSRGGTRRRRENLWNACAPGDSSSTTRVGPSVSRVGKAGTNIRR